MSLIAAKTRFNLSIPPSCVAFSPLQPDFVVIGTYFLDKDAGLDEAGQQQRTGSLNVYKLVNHELVEQSQTSLPSAVLDIVFSPHDTSLLYTATSTGSVLAHRLESGSLVPLATHQLLPESELVLDIACHPTQPHVVGITTSTGGVALAHLPPAVPSPVQLSITTHSLEAWTLFFSPTGDFLYHGADDASLAYTPLTLPSTPSSLPEINPSLRPGKDPRIHTAGVTAILPLHSSGLTHILLTGSYDDHMRVVRLPRRSVSVRTLLEHDLGGGVWRLALIHSTARGERREWNVLASCMHAGARVVRVTCQRWTETVEGHDEGDGGWEVEVLARFEEHASMNYGSDVRVQDGQATVVSSSFYDRLVCVWDVKLPHAEMADSVDGV